MLEDALHPEISVLLSMGQETFDMHVPLDQARNFILYDGSAGLPLSQGSRPPVGTPPGASSWAPLLSPERGALRSSCRLQRALRGLSCSLVSPFSDPQVVSLENSNALVMGAVFSQRG